MEVTMGMDTAIVMVMVMGMVTSMDTDTHTMAREKLLIHKLLMTDLQMLMQMQRQVLDLVLVDWDMVLVD